MERVPGGYSVSFAKRNSDDSEKEKSTIVGGSGDEEKGALRFSLDNADEDGDERGTGGGVGPAGAGSVFSSVSLEEDGMPESGRRLSFSTGGGETDTSAGRTARRLIRRFSNARTSDHPHRTRRAIMVDSIRRFSTNPASFIQERRKSRSHSLASFKLSYYPHDNPDSYDEGIGLCGWILTALSWLLIIATFPLSICFCLKVVQEYERAVIFRLGRLIGGGAKGPGIFFILPCIENYTKVDLRTVSFDVPPQEILTKDSVTVSVDAVVYYRVSNATVSVANVENAHHSTRLLAQTTLRNMLGTKNLSEILSDREAISSCMQSLLDDATDSWGIKVERVEIKDVRLPIQLQRAMAAEAEAAREARAKVIAAEGEQKASRALKEAAEVLAVSPSALQLRYLQTLSSISAEKNSTIIFPLPVDLLKHFIK